MKEKTRRGMTVAACIAILTMMLFAVSACNLLGGRDGVLIVGAGRLSGIQDAIDLAEGGDTIIVLPGTYREALNFNGKSITLRSATRQELDDLSWDYPGEPDDFDIVAETVIDGGGADIVIALDSGEERDAEIKGLTITGGGRGIFVSAGSTVAITDSIIENNTNGGIVLQASSTNADHSETPSSAIITGNTIRGNAKSVGAGVYVGYNAEAVIEDNLFTNNTATQTSAAYGGGAIGLYTFSTRNTVNVIRNNTFSGNTAYRVGGAIFLMGDGTVTTITGNQFTGNVADPNSQASGGGIYIRSCQSATIHGNSFTNNSAAWRGGAMVILDGKTYGSGNTLMTYANYGDFNTFTGNTADTTEYDDIYVDS